MVIIGFICPCNGGDIGGGGGTAKGLDWSLCVLEYMVGGGGGGPPRVPGRLSVPKAGDSADGARVVVDARGRKPEKFAAR